MGEGILRIVKFAIFIVILPIIVSVTLSFQRELTVLPSIQKEYFYWGIVCYLFSNLFLYGFHRLFEYMKKLISELFHLTGAFSRFLVYLFPLYTIMVIMAYFVFRSFLRMGPDAEYYFFLLGFTLALHVVLSAAQIHEEDQHMFKSTYLFAMPFIYIANIMVTVFMLSLVVPKLSFMQFLALFNHTSLQLYHKVLSFLL